MEKEKTITKISAFHKQILLHDRFLESYDPGGKRIQPIKKKGRSCGGKMVIKKRAPRGSCEARTREKAGNRREVRGLVNGRPIGGR